jgi:hypothetical protein
MQTRGLTFKQGKNMLLAGVCKRLKVSSGQSSIYHNGRIICNEFTLLKGIVHRVHVEFINKVTPATDCEYHLEVVE